MVVGKMKDEYKGIPINKFVGLKPKMHSVLSDDAKRGANRTEALVSLY